MSKRAERESYAIVPETWPFVDAALSKAEELIKNQTGALRDALTEALERALDAENEVERLTSVVSTLYDQLESLTSEIEEMHSRG